ncbi:DciA family protein [Thiocapsa sp.]|uniref:DciA family protein n=1 Tax=Thiocapsa sp. TaxID=2024551 RepID=UPI00359437BE
MLRPGLAHVRELLQSNRLIRRHLEHRDRELALFGIALGRLPDPLRLHCRDATLGDGVLTLYFDSPAWVTRARFLIEDLTRSLGREGVVKVVTRVRIRAEVEVPASLQVGPGSELQTPPSGGSRLTARTIAHLLGAAQGMSDPVLAEVFRRFAKNHTPAALTTAGDGRGESPGSRGVGKTPAAESD